jgi:uracil-DNA glycosylase
VAQKRQADKNKISKLPTDSNELSKHIATLKTCTLCPAMIGPVITHRPVASKIYLCGQAPGVYEGDLGRPFAWTAGKTMFKWFSSIGVDEEIFRSRAYIGAVCRCFPGKASGGGDRVPSPNEVKNCSRWMEAEFKIMQPELVIPVGRLAIDQFLPKQKLTDVIGKQFRKEAFGTTCDIIPLPHPSGASSWFKIEPGLSLTKEALVLLANHPVWIDTLSN